MGFVLIIGSVIGKDWWLWAAVALGSFGVLSLGHTD
jgi:hypothetical protein